MIKNAHIVNHDDIFDGDILIEDNVITKIAKNIDEKNADLIDAEGRLVFPGFIDAHTHPGLPEDLGYMKNSNDFYTETKAALAGGTTTIYDFAEQKKGERLIHALMSRRKRAEGNVQCRYGFHIAITDVQNDIYDQLKEVKAQGVTTVKLYTTYAMMLNNYDILKVMDCCAALDMVVLVHCEDDGIVKYSSKFSEYNLTRPREAEVNAVAVIANLAKITGCKVYFCHISCSDSIDIIKIAEEKGVKAYIETCPQYLLLNSSKYKSSNEKEVTKFILSPPLREEEDNRLLLKACIEGDVDLISTDHCAFLYKEHKARYCGDLSRAAKGMPGVQLRTSLMYDLLVEKNKLSLSNFVKLLSYNPAKILGLKDRGYIGEGMKSDIVIWDTGKFKVSMDMIIEGTDYSPYEGLELIGKPAYIHYAK